MTNETNLELAEMMRRLKQAGNGLFPPSPLGDYGVCDEAAALIQSLSERIAVLEGHVRALIGLVEANTMPLSKDEYRYVQAARASLTPQEPK
jgi:hypothetical protein